MSRSNDNALVEGKNARVVRRHLGHEHIPARFADDVDAFARGHLSPFVNFHRPGLYATEYVDSKGKVRRKHLRDDVKTPYEKLKSLSGATGNLKPSLTFGALDRIAGAQSDLEAARALNAARPDNVNLFASGASASRTRFRHPRLFVVHARQGSDSILLFDWLCASSRAKAVALAVCRPWGFSESVMGTVPAMRGARRGDRSRRLESGESGERRPEDSGTRQMARGGAKTAGETRYTTHSRQPQVVQPLAVIGQRHLGPLALHLVETATSFSVLLPRPLTADNVPTH